MKRLYLILLLTLFLITSVSAFQLEKHLVQIEQDENYPCYVSDDTIICPAIDDAKIKDWKDKLEAIPDKIDDETGKGKLIDNPNKNKGKLTDNQKKAWLDSRVVPYEKPNQQKQIVVTNEYREKINPYSLKDDEQIKIGFNTNVFGVSGTPLENFDVNSTTGMVRYRPLNMTWLKFTGSNDYVNPSSMNSYQPHGNNLSVSVWFFSNSTDLNNRNLVSLGSSNEISIRILNITSVYAQIKNGTSTGKILNVTQFSNPLNDSLWHNLIITYDKSLYNLSIYLDNVYGGSNNLTLAGTYSVSSFPIIGSNGGGFSASLDGGGIDEVRECYNTPLPTVSQINEIYSSKRIRNDSLFNCSGAQYKMWFPFNEKQTLVARDYLQGRNGTIAGATWQSDNINVTTLGYEVNISIQNITHAKIYWSNGTIFNNSMYGFTGNVTFTFLNNDTIQIDEYWYNSTQGGVYYEGQGNFTGTTSIKYNNTLYARISKSITYRNLNNALVYWKNGTLINSSANNELNLSVPFNNETYLLNNFNLTEGVNRENNPIWISSSSNTLKKIASNLSIPINTTVIINIENCNDINTIKYIPHSKAFTLTYNRGSYTCDSTTNTALLLLQQIEPASSSNELTISYDYQLNKLCNKELLGLASFGELLPLIIIAIIFGLVLVFLFGNANSSDISFAEDNTGIIIAVAVMMSIGGIIITNIIGAGC